jgi:RHS repeat-associated protein
MSPAMKRFAFAVALILLGAASKVLAGVTVTLDVPANGSTHSPGGNIALTASSQATGGYSVSKVEFFQGSTLIATDTSSPYSITWNNVPQGHYTLTAKATAIKKGNPDQSATSSPVDINVTTPPSVTLISPIADSTLPSALASFSATASDSDGTIAMVRFIYGQLIFWDSGTFTVSQPPYSAVVALHPVIGGENGLYPYSIRAEAVDNDGAVTATATINFTVPRIGIVSPAQNAIFSAPANISIEPYVVNGDGAVTSVEFFAGSTLIGTASSAPFNFNWTSVPQGSYSITARTNDGFTSSPVSITVNPGGPALHFIHVDHLNTPRLVANSAGTTVWRWDQQEPFGVNVPDENPSGLGAFDLPLRLPGQYFDKETNLFYNYFRDYDPSIGRYVESDPIGLAAGLNTYVYVDGAPILSIDPAGLCPKDFDTGWWLSAVAFQSHAPKFGQCQLYQTRSRMTGMLVTSSGTCDCGAASMTCTYSVKWEQNDRDRPADCKRRVATGNWSEWQNYFSSDWGLFSLTYDCKTQQLGPPGKKL